MTPDNLPLLGPVGDIGGLWAAEAVWVTHAAGAADALAQLMTGTRPDIAGLEALAPGRFAGRTDQELTESSLRLYRDLYSSALQVRMGQQGLDPRPEHTDWARYLT